MKIKLATSAALVALLAAAGCGSSGTDAAAKSGEDAFTFGIFNVPTVVLAGLQSGEFKGLNMKTTALDSGPAALPLVKRGDLAGISDASANPILIGLSTGIPLKIVWVTSQAKYHLVANKNISSAADLKGKKVAIVPGSILDYVLDGYLTQNGMTAKDVKKVDLPPPSMPAALKTGQIDAAYVWDPFASQMLADGGVELASNKDSGYVVLSGDFVKKHPDETQSLVCAYASTQRAFLKDSQSGYAAIGKQIKLDPKQVEAAMPADTVVDPDKSLELMGTASQPGPLAASVYKVGLWLKGNGGIKTQPSQSQVDSLFDPTFAEAALDGKCAK